MIYYKTINVLRESNYGFIEKSLRETYIAVSCSNSFFCIL